MRDDIFTQHGGKFISSPSLLKEKLKKVKAFIFDWDGVFNRGEKGTIPSPFNETDSMGMNMLRFAYYLMHRQMPFTAIVTGETNQTAFNWSRRENLDHVFFQVKNKVQVLSLLKERYSIEKEEIMFMFDDILDISLADQAGVRFLVRREANPLFMEYCIKHGYCDYVTYSTGGDYAIREVTELVLSAWDLFDRTIDSRIAFDEDYQEFLAFKKQIKTDILKSDGYQFLRADI